MQSIYDYLKGNNLDIHTIIECGGHTGTDTEKLLKQFPDATIHCVEANVTLFNQYLSPLAERYDNLAIYNIGFAGTNGSMIFYVDTDPKGDAGASSLLRANPRGGLCHLYHIEKPIEINCVTLEKFLSDQTIDRVNLLWLDIEQYEYEVLKACSPTILDKIDFIYLEVNYQQFRQNGKLYKDIYELLQNRFTEEAKYSQGSPSFTWQANVLFKNKKK